VLPGGPEKETDTMNKKHNTRAISFGHQGHLSDFRLPEKSPLPQSLATLGTLLFQSLQIRSLDELERWGTVVQSFIEVAESQNDPVLPSLLGLKDSVYRKWVHPIWKDSL